MVVIRVAPLYQQLAERISTDVAASLSPGSRLPSERVMCQTLGVSRVTLRSALSLLAAQGEVASSAARGWFRTGSQGAEPVTSPLLGFTETARTRHQSTTARVLSADIRPASLDEADTFGIVPGSPVFHLQRLRFLNGLVIAIDMSRIPAEICPNIETHDFAVESLYRVLRNAPQPVIPTVADYAVEAVPADADESVLLELPPTMPLLVASQTTRDQHGRTFELGTTRYRGDRFRFRASLGACG